MTAMVELRDVSMQYGAFTAIDRMTFSLPSTPSATAIAGESGSGKTTVARMVLGFIKPTKGQVTYRGKDIAKMSGSEKRTFRREVQPIFQDPFDVYNPFYKVDHVMMVAVKKFGLAQSETEGRKLIEDALSKVGLRPKDTLGRFPHELSGGQRQRIMVARAVLLRPKLIMADEPVSMVDASLRATILDELNTLRRELGISIVYITHDLTTAYQVCDNIMILYQGTVAEAGAADKVIGSPQHPYSRLLVSSIPGTDRSVGWGDEQVRMPEGNAGKVSTGCRFAPRCPSVMSKCWTDAPPKFRVGPDQLASCFLYSDGGVVPSKDVSTVFQPGAPVA